MKCVWVVVIVVGVVLAVHFAKELLLRVCHRKAILTGMTFLRWLLLWKSVRPLALHGVATLTGGIADG